MGFASKRMKTRAGKEAPKKSKYTTIGAVWASKKYEGQFSIRINENRTSADGTEYPAAGKVFFEDAKTGKLYQVKQIYMFESKPEVAEKGLAYNLALDLTNDYSVAALDADEAVAVGAPDSDEDTSYEADLADDSDAEDDE